ncbi:hypothetical protein KKI24_05715 [bacterium]|nr:hypothetical protein [bacterium]
MSETKPISLDQFRKRKEKEAAEQYYPGKLVWLFCPKCETLEYTEIVSKNGRMHKCGTLVEEREVELDLRAEITMTEYNLEIINALLKKNSGFKLIKIISKSLDKALIALQSSEQTYREKLLLAAGMNIPLYPGNIDSLKDKLPIKDINPLGLIISEFRFEPEKRFNLKPSPRKK